MTTEVAKTFLRHTSFLTLLRPHLLSCKNRLRQEIRERGCIREVLLFGITGILVFAIYQGTTEFLLQLRSHPNFTPVLVEHLLSLCLFAFFLLLVFSNAIAALSHLYSAKDMSFLLALPIRPGGLYIARLIEVLGTSSWMFLLFTIPSLVGLYQAWDLPATFFAWTLVIILAFTLIPACLAMAFVTCLVNLVPVHRMRDVLIILAFCFLTAVLVLTQNTAPEVSTDQQKMNDLIRYLSDSKVPPIEYLPSVWAARAFFELTQGNSPSYWVSLLLGTAVGSFALGYLLFEVLFHRGWGMSLEERRQLKVYGIAFGEWLGRFLIPYNSRLRALCYKELRMFVRDTTQSLQLLMLLMLTFVYLYNFRALRLGSNLSDSHLAWWQVVLATANVSFGTCVVSAIATRFVYPSVSLEGGAWTLLRNTPLTIEQFVRYKFTLWAIPIGIVCMVLLVSGAWAIHASPVTVLVTIVLGLCLTIGIVGLGVGVGALYARFDWDSPAQVTASFGSLVYLFFAMVTIGATIIPAVFMFMLTCVPSFSAHMSSADYTISLLCLAMLVFYINAAAARKALASGADRLSRLED